MKKSDFIRQTLYTTALATVVTFSLAAQTQADECFADCTRYINGSTRFSYFSNSGEHDLFLNLGLTSVLGMEAACRNAARRACNFANIHGENCRVMRVTTECIGLQGYGYGPQCPPSFSQPCRQISPASISALD